MAGNEDIQCYNKGCGLKYNPAENTEEACRYHPGVPVFHDALKGWSCCKKRSTDFTEFLNFPGCTNGKHSNEKPPEPEKQVPQDTDKNEVITETVTHAPKLPVPMPRPSASEPMVRLSITVGQTLKSALEKQMKDITLQENQEDAVESGDVPIGTSCKNNACKKTYEGESSNTNTCLYHPGSPIFHEGMKYWSCCKRKTSEFDNFLAQEGCVEGKHVWFKKEDCNKMVVCRHDWHQTGTHVIISVFSKLSLPETSWVEANQVAVKINIVYEGGKSVFENHLLLKGVVDPKRSSVKMLGAKVEINLRKAEPGSWSTLELPVQQAAEGGDKSDTTK